MIINKLLIVDDQPNWRKLLKWQLKPEGFDIDSAKSKEEALGKIEESAFGLIVVDLCMEEDDLSNLDGLLLMKEVREKYPIDPIDFFVLTGHGTKESVYDSLKKYGAFDFIDKGSGNDMEKLKLSIKDAVQKRKDSKDYNQVLGELREQFLPAETIAALVSQLPSKWTVATNPVQFLSGVYAERSIGAVIYEVLPDTYLPFCSSIRGPELILSEPPISRILCWSRATQEALALFIQSGEDGLALPKESVAELEEWGYKIAHEKASNRGFLASSFVLRNIRFKDFKSLVIRP